MSQVLKQVIADRLGNNQRVHSRQIRPTTVAGGANGQTRFLLPQTGILHQGAYITLQVKTASKVNFQPLSAGIHSLIRRATIYSGNKTIMSVDNAGIMANIKRHFKTVEDRAQRDGILHGCVDALMVGNEQVMSDAVPPVLVSDERQKGVGKLDIKQPTVTYNANRSVAKIDSPYRYTTDPAKSNTYCVKLSELFPSFLAGIQLPLGLMRDPVSIELIFQDDRAGERCCYVKNSPVQPSGSAFVEGNEVVADSLILFADLLFYSSGSEEVGVMEALTDAMNGPAGLSFEYTDTVAVQSSYPQLTGGAPGAGNAVDQPLNNIIGMTGENVRNLLIATPRQQDNPTTTGGDSGNGLLGTYFSHAPQGEQTLNVKANNKPVYTGVGFGGNGSAQFADQLQQVYGLPCNVSMTQYSAEGSLQGNAWAGGTQQGLSQALMEQYNMNELRAMYNFMGVPLQLTRANVAGAGLSIGLAPLELIMNRVRTNENFGALYLYVFAEVERAFSLKNGIVFLSGL